MKKETLIGIAVIIVLFVGFTYFSTRQQKDYQQKMAVWQASQDSLQAASQPVMTPADTSAVSAVSAADTTAVGRQQAAQMQPIAMVGDSLAMAQAAEPQQIVVENDVMKVRFSTRGGRVTGVTLKNYTKYGPRGHRDTLVELVDSATARFNMLFYLKKDLKRIPVNTMDYVFTAEPVRQVGDAQRVAMRLPVGGGGYLEYEYLIYNKKAPARDYLVDFNVHWVDMAEQLAAQSAIDIDWMNNAYPLEEGFRNENTYTTLAYRLAGESDDETLGISIENKSKSDADTDVNWVAFKQQYFSSVFIAPQNVSADMTFAQLPEDSPARWNFEAKMSVPYTLQDAGYNFAFYFGPNDFSILKKVVDNGGNELQMERLVPLGWGIFGWINRYFVIPVFDFLRHYIASFGIVILILVFLVKLIISPLTYKSYVSMAKMRLVKPQIDEVNKKYPNKEDALKKQQATMEVYKKSGINPMGGCLPMLIQMPIWIALFRFFPNAIELRAQPFLWAGDLSSYDSIVNLPFSIPFYGDHVSLFALLMAVALYGYSYYNYQQTAGSQPQMPGMKFMTLYLMPVLMLFWFNGYASGLSYYYFLSNLITIVQTLIIRHMVSDGKIKMVMAANAAKKGKGKKSKFQLRYEEMLRQQEAMQNRSKKK